ncbi:MAG: zinc ribbon domain-containing protein [Promethearchaeota archaeon]|jgi:ribosomal protein S27AE
MPANSPMGFCPRCNQQVLLARKQFDTCLAIVLLLFTGIGFFIYLAVYYSKKEDRCVHCGTQISFSQGQVQFQPSVSTPSQTQNQNAVAQPQLLKYCPLCGEKLEAQVKYCPNCGGKIT